MKNHGATLRVAATGVVVDEACWLVDEDAPTVDVDAPTVDVVVGSEVGVEAGIDPASDEDVEVGAVVVVAVVATGSAAAPPQAATNIVSATATDNLRLTSLSPFGFEALWR
jgi:hypothetical protein